MCLDSTKLPPLFLPSSKAFATLYSLHPRRLRLSSAPRALWRCPRARCASWRLRTWGRHSTRCACCSPFVLAWPCPAAMLNAAVHLAAHPLCQPAHAFACSGYLELRVHSHAPGCHAAALHAAQPAGVPWAEAIHKSSTHQRSPPQKVATRLRYTPRRLLVYPEAPGSLIIAESDHAAVPLAEREDLKERLQVRGVIFFCVCVCFWRA